jgi:hypothetical protein
MKRIRHVLFAVLALSAVAGGLFLAAHSVYADDGVPDEEGMELISEVPNAAGFTPCAVFDVNGWGDKWINLDDYPSCDFYQPYLTVQCFTDEGTWTDTTVDHVIYRPMYEFETGPVLTFDSTQHGVCGIFPTGEGYAGPEMGYAETIFILLEAFGEEVSVGAPTYTLTVDSLPAYVILSDGDAAPPGDALYVIATTDPASIPWEALDAGYYIVEQPANLEWSEMPEHLFGGQTEFDEYPEGIFYVTVDPDDTTFEPLP